MKKQHGASFEAQCRVCEWARTLSEEEHVLCEKRGIVQAAFHCRRFSYDPLKRKPSAILPPPKLEYVSLDED